MEQIEILRLIVTGLGTVIIPITVVWLGNTVSRTFREKEIRLRYIEIAISVLRQSPSETDATLREWAVTVIGSYSEIALPEEAKEQLLTKRPLPSDRDFEWQKSYYEKKFE